MSACPQFQCEGSFVCMSSVPSCRHVRLRSRRPIVHPLKWTLPTFHRTGQPATSPAFDPPICQTALSPSTVSPGCMGNATSIAIDILRAVAVAFHHVLVFKLRVSSDTALVAHPANSAYFGTCRWYFARFCCSFRRSQLFPIRVCLCRLDGSAVVVGFCVFLMSVAGRIGNWKI